MWGQNRFSSSVTEVLPLARCALLAVTAVAMFDAIVDKGGAFVSAR